jgi:hypothetical protein
MEEQKNILQEIRLVLEEIKRQKKRQEKWIAFAPLLGVLIGGFLSFFATYYLNIKQRELDEVNNNEIIYADYISLINQYKDYQFEYNKDLADLTEIFISVVNGNKVNYTGLEERNYKLKFEVLNIKAKLISKFAQLKIIDRPTTNSFNDMINYDYDIEGLCGIIYKNKKDIDSTTVNLLLEQLAIKDSVFNDLCYESSDKITSFLIINKKIK